MIGRTRFVGDLIYSVGVSGFIYPIIGHWAWGPDGFLATMGSDGNFLPVAGNKLSRLRRFDRGPHYRRLDCLAGAIVWARVSAENSRATAVGRCCLMI